MNAASARTALTSFVSAGVSVRRTVQPRNASMPRIEDCRMSDPPRRSGPGRRNNRGGGGRSAAPGDVVIQAEEVGEEQDHADDC